VDTPQPDSDKTPPAPRAKVLVAFAIVYVVWGSTYLAIRFAVETLPPFLMGGARFLVAGLALFLWVRWRGVRAEPGQWRIAGIAGVLLLFGGNGALVWSEQRVASGIAALLVATLPVWMVLLDWLRPGGSRPPAGVFAGLALGLGGLALLVGPAAMPSTGRAEVDLAAAGVLVLGSISWAAGSIFLRNARHAGSVTLSNAMQMLVGGATLAIAGIGAGELDRLSLETASARSVISLAYLAVFGSLIGFSAYTYILRVSTPARVATYAYVNPVVAMLLGWAFASEPITVRTLIAAAIILAGVAIIGVAEGANAAADRAKAGTLSDGEDVLRSRPLARR
jgi:drug/metabolite transporter (DMT)-like permease